ncbi:MAG TPA: hypothetical protein VEW48_23620 [Thermoanaerobaculia bacterium]|nr:hypothetical protein [Thermoanaerobaculia bacterium]
MKKSIPSGARDSWPHGGIGDVAVLNYIECTHNCAVVEQKTDRAGLAPPPSEAPKIAIVIVECPSPLLTARILDAGSDPQVETKRTGFDACQVENGYRGTKTYLADSPSTPLVDEAQVTKSLGKCPDQGRGRVPDRTVGARTQRRKVMVEARIGEGAIMTLPIPRTMHGVVEAYESTSRLQIEKLGARRQDRRRSGESQGM